MKVAKLKKVKEKKPKQVLEDQYSIKKILTLILIIIIVFTIFYFITTLIVKNKNEEEINNEIVEIDSNKITVSQLLNRNENEYYVLATKESLYLSLNIEMNYNELYDNYIDTYKEQENSLPVYKIDLDDALNKSYWSETLNINNDLSKLELNDEILFKIKNNTIEEYYAGSSEILKALKRIIN